MWASNQTIYKELLNWLIDWVCHENQSIALNKVKRNEALWVGFSCELIGGG